MQWGQRHTLQYRPGFAKQDGQALVHSHVRAPQGSQKSCVAQGVIQSLRQAHPSLWSWLASLPAGHSQDME